MIDILNEISMIKKHWEICMSDENCVMLLLQYDKRYHIGTIALIPKVSICMIINTLFDLYNKT